MRCLLPSYILRFTSSRSVCVSSCPHPKSFVRCYNASLSKQSLYQPCRDAESLLMSPRNSDPSPRAVEIVAHVRSVRLQKRRAFISLGDGSTVRPIQALLSPDKAVGLTTGTAVKIKGSWQPSPPSKEQTHELVAEEVDVLGQADPETYPIRKQYLTPEYLRTIPHLRVRTPSNALLARLRSEAEHHISTYFRNDGYVRLHPPVITSSDCEGAGEVFSVRPRGDSETTDADPENDNQLNKVQHGETEFFKAPKYLTVSAQLHLEAFVHEHQRVWALGPTFRAERSDTPRHLSEFYMLEGELRCTTLGDVMDVVEGLVRYIAKGIQDSPLGKEFYSFAQRGGEDVAVKRLQSIKSRMDGLRRSYWPRITYTHAIGLLKDAVKEKPDIFHFSPSWENGLQVEHEKYLAAAVGGGSPVFVTNYPRNQKPFYMLPTLTPERKTRLCTQPSSTSNSHGWTAHTLPPKPSPEEQLEQAHPTVACFDLLLPEIGELVGGSLREHDYVALKARMEEQGLEGLSWYLELRQYGSIPHGGFGMGFDRLIMYLSGVDSVRDIVQWPRYHGRCDA